MDGEWELDKEGAGRVKIKFGKGETSDGETGRGRRGLEKREETEAQGHDAPRGGTQAGSSLAPASCYSGPWGWSRFKGWEGWDTGLRWLPSALCTLGQLTTQSTG